MIPEENWIAAFLTRIKRDPRISIVHIGIFTVMANCCNKYSGSGYCIVHRNTLMQAAKISSATTYYKVVNELSAYGYIGYYPSRCPVKGVFITLLPTMILEKTLNHNN